MTAVDHIRGETFHGRKGAVANSFRYGVDYVLLDPEASVGPGLFSRNRRNLTALWDVDHGGLPGAGRGVVWVREVLAAAGFATTGLEAAGSGTAGSGSAGLGAAGSEAAEVKAAGSVKAGSEAAGSEAAGSGTAGLEAAEGKTAGSDAAGVKVGRIALLAQPRVMGHVFNPVSFWLCWDAAGGLRVVIAEVSNTFGDRHSYLCHRDDRGVIGPSDILTAQKVFHVSPFQPVAGGYTFRFDICADRIGIWIDHTNAEGGIYATLTGPRRPLTNGAILWACLRRPFGSRRVLALIHWQAVKLAIKGARFRRRPLPPVDEVSR